MSSSVDNIENFEHDHYVPNFNFHTYQKYVHSAAFNSNNALPAYITVFYYLKHMPNSAMVGVKSVQPQPFSQFHLDTTYNLAELVYLTLCTNFCD